MGRRRNGSPPPYLHHKGTNQAYSVLWGVQTYHGAWGTAASRAAYTAFLKRWEAQEGVVAEPNSGTISELAHGYQSAIVVHLSEDEQRAFRVNLRDLEERYGELPPEQFGPRQLKDLRDVWIRAGNARQTCNKKVGRIRRVFRWAVEEEMVPASVLTALEAVGDILPGRSEAPDYEEVYPVPLRDLVRTLRVLTPVLRAMVLVQYYVGSRPGEICRMRPEELHRGTVKIAGRTIRLPEGSWAFTPQQHKNLKKGKHLAYLLGPRAQRVLLPYLANSPCLFSREPTGRVRKHRPRKPGTPYRSDLYASDIADACKLAGIPPWSPGMLRHNFASRLDKLAGIAATSTAMGHASLSTTSIYIERDIRAAAELALRHG